VEPFLPPSSGKNRPGRPENRPARPDVDVGQRGDEETEKIGDDAGTQVNEQQIRTAPFGFQKEPEQEKGHGIGE